MNTKIKLVVSFLLCSSVLLGFENINTHPELTRLSAKINMKYHDDFLKQEMLMTEGIEQPIGVTTIIELLKGGSKYEDEGKRASHHFHRPIPSDGSIGQKPWSDAGIMDPWLLDLITSDAPKYSAAVWATDYLGPDQPHESEPLTNNEYNWDRARE